MPEFIFEANDDTGLPVTGELLAESVSAAIAEIESRGWTVNSIRLSSLTEEPTSASARSRLDDPPARQGSSLAHQFDDAIQRKEVLVPVLTALSEEMPSPLARRELRQLVGALRRARSGAELRHNRVAAQWLPLLVTGITSESATRRLSDLVAHTFRESENRSNRRRLLAYPFLVIVITAALFMFLCVFIVPTFGEMFADFGLSLPLSTSLVLSVADQLRFNPVQFLITVGLIAAVIYALARLWFHFALSTRLFGFATAGNSASVSAMSSLTSRLAELLCIDVPLADALCLAGQGCGHYHYKVVVERLARHVHHNGVPLSDCPVAHNLPANVIYALEAGEDGRPNVALLRELSAMYSERAAQRVDWSTGAVGPIAIVMVGIVVGFIVIALFSPLANLVTGLS
jgi:type IV pilus assembly protein PilC